MLKLFSHKEMVNYEQHVAVKKQQIYTMKKLIYIFIAIILMSFTPKLFKEKWTKEQAPSTFKACFETTQGDFEILAVREYSPKAVDRL